ncbi:BA75_02234T0 [Komagataella pastoris]|uniref:BA75_02234T0 n=1 Tax=Komagataella pastoris TaxID=4922 RepID=A0A1B2JB18_PICPA|nr:BA75_02234T0 [Komagataella pastoris]
MPQSDSERPQKRAKLDQKDPIVNDKDHDDDIGLHTNDSATNKLSQVRNIYFSTINRHKLDFDFEKKCQVTLSKSNVYCCLVCGKYLQGRAPTSQAYLHSLDVNHHLFISFSTLKTFALPEGFEVKDQDGSLDDIKELINPTYTREQVASLDKQTAIARDLDGNPYRPGFIGLNNVKGYNDYSNTVLLVLGHIEIVRNHYLLNSFNDSFNQELGLFIRRMWSSKLFRPHISPAEIMRLVTEESKNRFNLTQQKTPREFFLFLLHLMPHRVRNSFRGAAGGSLFLIIPLILPKTTVFNDKTPQINLQTLINQFENDKPVKEVPRVLLLHFERDQQDIQLDSVSGSAINNTIINFPQELQFNQTYKLVANIVQDIVQGSSGEDTIVYKVQLYDKGRDEWLQIHDLKVQVIERELLFLHQSVLQVWERKI